MVSGPEALRQPVERRIDLSRQPVRLRRLGQQQRQRLVPRPRLDVINALHRAQIHRVDRQPVEGVGGQRHHVACGEGAYDMADQQRLRFFRVNAKRLGRQ
jgi:hypothetical protein